MRRGDLSPQKNPHHFRVNQSLLYLYMGTKGWPSCSLVGNRDSLKVDYRYFFDDETLLLANDQANLPSISSSD